MKTVRSFIAILGVLGFCLNAIAQNPQGDVDLRKAAQDGDVKAVNDLVRLSADVNGRDKTGRTPLLWGRAGTRQSSNDPHPGSQRCGC